MNTPQQATQDLATALGILIAHEHNPPQRQPAYHAYIESVIILAHKAGLTRQQATQPFDHYQPYAQQIWDQLDQMT